MARWIIFLLINDAENYSTLFLCCLTVSYKAENHFLSTLNVDIFYVDDKKKLIGGEQSVMELRRVKVVGYGQFNSTANVFN